jgi:phenylalanyl-tRNA synthetase beta chain
MLVSFKWLRDYIDIDLSPQDVADRLTMIGLEVDAIKEVKPDFEGVVTAKILEIRPHPNADKLSLCSVTDGDKTYPVVCGAKNIRIGALVALARVGAHLPGGYTIKSSKIRSEQSEGMLCSEEELGVGSDSTGIMMLGEDLPLGEDLSKAMHLEDVVFDISITPNRSDCLSMVGIAREVAAATGTTVRYPAILFEEAGEEITRVTAVDIMNSELCPRYSARVVQGVKIGPSPAWIRQRLEAVGLRPINNVVDVTNFVMMELGQPLHAFDFRFLEGRRIVVRGAQEGEEFVSLDGKTRTLMADTLMICDGVKPVAIAGVMGGLNSEIQDDTETVFIESAYFNPASIRRTARMLGMSTDAAYRFERGIDPDGVIRALDRAAQLIAQTGGGIVCRGLIDNYPRIICSAKDILLRTARIEKVLGVAVSEEKVINILTGLGMVVKKQGNDFLVTPPTYRVDISREIDLIEEIARLHGYDCIPTSIPSISVKENLSNNKKAVDEMVCAYLNGYGYSEVVNYSFTTPESADILNLGEADERRLFVRIINPITEDQSVMRTTLLFGLLETMKNNLNDGSYNLKLFEKGKIFFRETSRDVLPREKVKLGALLTGTRYDERWSSKEVQSDYYDLKGCMENLLAFLRIEPIHFLTAKDIPFLHPGRSSRIFVDKREIGVIGEVHPGVLSGMDIKRRAIIAELDYDFLINRYNDKVVFKEIKKFPAASRDAAFLVGKDIEADKLIKLALSEKEELLERIEVFDVYIGQNIPDGMKSLALRFTYRSGIRTLTDDEVSRMHGRIMEIIVNGTGATVRG